MAIENFGDNDCSMRTSNQSMSSLEISKINEAQTNKDGNQITKPILKLIEEKTEFIITKSPSKKLARLRTPTNH
jgi:hypothetical protein